MHLLVELGSLEGFGFFEVNCTGMAFGDRDEVLESPYVSSQKVSKINVPNAGLETKGTESLQPNQPL